MYLSNYQPSRFESNHPQFDQNKTLSKGKIFTLNKDISLDGKIDINDLQWRYLEGDGDFRSDEIKQLRDEADIIITNPPFSLFRVFLTWINPREKQFLIIGNMNAITYKEVFPLIKENIVWLGNNYKVNGGAMYYEIPEAIANMEQVREVRKKSDETNAYITRVQGVRWFTNLNHGRLHEKLKLMNEADNLKYNAKKLPTKYQEYDNYDAIEVPLVILIPSDYKGVMGVPISFLDKYCPEQFEILGTSDNGIIDDLYKKTQGLTQQFVDDYYKAGGKGAYKEGNPTAGIYKNGAATTIFKRIFIKHKEVN